MENKTKAKPKFQNFLQEDMRDHHQNLTDLIIKKMEDSVKYEKPWFSCDLLPYNPVTGTKYKGVNIVSLMMRGFDDPRFLTFKNIQKLSEELETPIMIIKGEKGIPVFKAMQKTVTKINEDTGEESAWSYWRQVYAGTVFNATQLTGIPALIERPKVEFNTEEEAEKILTAMVELSGLKIEHTTIGKACYYPSIDKIQLPLKENFKSSSLYYRTLMHELGHSTGHETRLNRKQTGKFGTDEYSFEELVAELSSYFLGATINLPYDSQTHENHAAYLKSWMEGLKKDKNLIFKAAGMASKSVEYQLNNKKTYYGENIENEVIEDTEVKKNLKLKV
jgi:antirestriction protein ArdC